MTQDLLGLGWLAALSAVAVVAGLVTFVIGLGFVFYAARYKSAFEAEQINTQAYKETTEAFGKKIAVLEDLVQERHHELVDALHTVGEQKKIIERLSALENIETIIKLMADSADRADSAAEKRLREGLEGVRETWKEMELAAVDRHKELVKTIRLMLQQQTQEIMDDIPED